MRAHVLTRAADYEYGLSIAFGYCDEIRADTEYVLPDVVFLITAIESIQTRG